MPNGQKYEEWLKSREGTEDDYHMCSAPGHRRCSGGRTEAVVEEDVRERITVKEISVV